MSITSACPNVTCAVGERAPSGIGSIILPPGLDWSDIRAPSHPDPIPTAEIAAKAASYALAIMLGVVGNSLVILIVIFSKRMRSMTNFYVANLAVSDLMVSAFCMWVEMGKNITTEWPFGSFMCKFNQFLQAWAVAASVFFLTVIAGDRFFAIVYPMGFRTSRRWSVLVFIATWICSAAVAAPHLFYDEMTEIRWMDRHEIFCEEVWPKYYYLTDDCECLSHSPGRNIYLTLQVVLFYFCPVVIITVTYVIVARTLWLRKVPGEKNDTTVQIQQKSRKKVVRMLITVLVVFVVCWTPFQCVILYDAHRPRNEDVADHVYTLKYVFTFMGYLNSAINPILYGALNGNFRQGFHDAFKGSLCRRANRVYPKYGTTVGTGATNNSLHTTKAMRERPKTKPDDNKPEGKCEQITITNHVTKVIKVEVIETHSTHGHSSKVAKNGRDQTTSEFQKGDAATVQEGNKKDKQAEITEACS